MLGADGFKISGDEEIDELFPFLVGLEGSSEDLDLTGEHPEDGSDGLGNSVVAGDDHIDEFCGGISVAKGDGGDVDV